MSIKSSRSRNRENALDAARKIAATIVEKKGLNVVIFDLKKISPITDYFVIAEGLSEVHNRAIAGYLIDAVQPNHIEGLESGNWVLIDYIDVVVHIFMKEVRSFYGLERLWGDARRITTEND